MVIKIYFYIEDLLFCPFKKDKFDNMPVEILSNLISLHIVLDLHKVIVTTFRGLKH